ncbi:MAG: hypothetical protein ACTSRU_19675 [Candidatus Hodarchaeales archaeon]
MDKEKRDRIVKLALDSSLRGKILTEEEVGLIDELEQWSRDEINKAWNYRIDDEDYRS